MSLFRFCHRGKYDFLIITLGDREQLSFMPDYIGRIWDKKIEIDVVAIHKKSKNILLGECKWTQRKTTDAVLDDLIRKSAALTKISGYKIHFALFSKSGFTANLIKRAAKEHVLLFEGAEFKRADH